MRGLGELVDDHSGDEGACMSMHQPWASLVVHGIKKVPVPPDWMQTALTLHCFVFTVSGGVLKAASPFPTKCARRTSLGVRRRSLGDAAWLLTMSHLVFFSYVQRSRDETGPLLTGAGFGSHRRSAPLPRTRSPRQGAILGKSIAFHFLTQPRTILVAAPELS